MPSFLGLIFFVVLVFIIWKLLNILVSFYELTKKYFLNTPVISVILTLLLFLYFGTGSNEIKIEIGSEYYEYFFSFLNMNNDNIYITYIWEKLKGYLNSLFNINFNMFKSDDNLL